MSGLGSSFNMAAMATVSTAPKMTVLQAAGFAMGSVTKIATGVSSMIANRNQGGALATAQVANQKLAGGRAELCNVKGSMASCIQSMKRDITVALKATGNEGAMQALAPAQQAGTAAEIAGNALTGGVSSMVISAVEDIRAGNNTGKSVKEVVAEIQDYMCNHSPSPAQAQTIAMPTDQPAAPVMENDWNAICEQGDLDLQELVGILSIDENNLAECAKYFPEAEQLMVCEAALEDAIGQNQETIAFAIQDLPCRVEISSESLGKSPIVGAVEFDGVIIPDCQDIVLAQNDNAPLAAQNIEPDPRLLNQFGMGSMSA